MSTENDALLGRKLGIYQVQSKLGEGGMAQVYKAYHPRLRREVAIKVILSEIAHSAGFQERFEQEAQMIASLEHTNIVSVYDFGEEGNLTYLVMQYVGGGTLRDQLRGKRPLEPQRAVRYAIQMALALHHAHQRGIVHRDVKPQNMLISSSDPNHLLLSDFGIAKLYYQSGEEFIDTQMPTRSVSNSSLTSASQIIGTADYMSPEQATGGTVDARTDVYALGVVLYQMLVGDIPFHSTTFQGLLFQQVYTPPPPIRERSPQVPEALAQITMKALSKAPADRFPSAEALARALEQANSNATLFGSSAGSQSNPAYRPLPPDVSGMPTNLASSPYPSTGVSASGPVTPWGSPAAQPPASTDYYATLDAPQTWPGSERATVVRNTQPPATGSAITGAPHISQARPARRRFPLSYLIGALVLIISLVVFGLRFLPGLTGSGSGTTGTNTTTTGAAQAFNELFQNNDRGWPSGSLYPGVTASEPSGGAYTVTLSTNNTAFPYPQNVGTLPDNFTLSATLNQTAGAPGGLFGIAFHFTQVSSSQVACYVLAITKSGQYDIYKYTDKGPTPVTSGSIQTSSQAYTLAVKAQGSNYSFFVNNQPLSFAVGAQAPSTTWTDRAWRAGHLALFFTGSNTGTTSTTAYIASNVQLTIP
ncbi:MAG TPA: protein kinase [Ktedonobacteraceae bacterium]